jgi:HEAT repeat protein
MIVGWLNDPNEAIRTAGAQSIAMVQQVSPDIVEALRGALNDPSADVRKAARQSCSALAPTSREVLEVLIELVNEPDPLTQPYIYRYISGLTRAASTFPEAAAALIRLLRHPSETMRSDTVAYLSSVFYAPAQQELKEVVTTLIGLFMDPSEKVRLALANNIMERNVLSRQQLPPETAEALKSALSDAREEVRMAAAVGLGSFGSDSAEVTEMLIRGASSDSGYVLRRRCIELLGLVDKYDERIVNILLMGFSNDDYSVRITCTASLITFENRNRQYTERIGSR